MWENEEQKTLKRNIIILVILVVAAVALLATMYAVKQRVNAEDALLKAESDSQRQELSAVRQENSESIELAYQQDMDTVAQYLPGIVCWGDSLTNGSAGNVSYPNTLQKYIDTYMCDIYDFASTLDNEQGVSRRDWTKYSLSIPVVNLGSGKEDSNTILGRSGVAPYQISQKFTIPAEAGEKVLVKFQSPDRKIVNPLTAGDPGINPVTIDGVEGTLTLERNPQTWVQSYYFARTESGEEIEVEKGAEIIPACADEYTNYVHIVWLGNFDNLYNPADLVRDTKELLSRQANNPDRYLVLSPCTVRGSWDSTDATLMDSIDTAMKQAFGNHYINVRTYLRADGLTDAGITPNTQEKNIIQTGRMPPNFRSSDGSAGLNGIAYKLIGKLVYDRMDNLGYFDEIRQELGLNKTTQEILKSNPQYFENILNAK